MPIPIIERSEREVIHTIKSKVRVLKEIATCKEVSIRSTRKKPSVHVHVVLKENPSYEEAHIICSMVETEIRHILSNVRVVILSESSSLKNQGEMIWKVVQTIAEEEPGCRGTQNIHLNTLNGKVGVDFALLKGGTPRADDNLPPVDVKEKLMVADLRISDVVIHEEYLSELVHSERSRNGLEAKWYTEHVLERFPDLRLSFPPTIRKVGDQFHAIVRVTPAPTIGHEKVVEAMSKLGAAIKSGYQAITKVDVIEV